MARHASCPRTVAQTHPSVGTVRDTGMTREVLAASASISTRIPGAIRVRIDAIS
jgi:hypothetical protein